MEKELEKHNKKQRFSRVLPIWKFILLSLITTGIYEFIWFYRHWKLLKEEKGLDIYPFWRVFFAPLLAGSITKYLKNFLAEKNVSKELLTSCNPKLIGITYFILSILWRLPDPYWLISFFTFIPMLPLIKATNAYWEKEDKHLPSKKFTWWQIVLISIGIFWLIISTIGTFMPE